MTGEFSLPVTGMSDMYKIMTVESDYVTMGRLQDTTDKVSGAIAPNATVNVACPTVQGFIPVGAVGYNISNSDSGTGESWITPYCINFNPGSGTVSCKLRNNAHVGSKESVNYKGGSSSKVKVFFRVLYLRKSDEYLAPPKDYVTTSSQTLSYGLTAYIARYGRICMVYINGSVNSAVTAWAQVGMLPKPIYPVIVANCGHMANLNSYLNLTQAGILQSSSNLPQGYYIQSTFSYITAD